MTSDQRPAENALGAVAQVEIRPRSVDNTVGAVLQAKICMLLHQMRAAHKLSTVPLGKVLSTGNAGVMGTTV